MGAGRDREAGRWTSRVWLLVSQGLGPAEGRQGVPVICNYKQKSPQNCQNFQVGFLRCLVSAEQPLPSFILAFPEERC